jgi:Co/Zn/Cd efflux system component
VLLDHQGPEELRARVRQALEAGGSDQVVDLHLWSLGSGNYACIVSVVALTPRPPAEYRARLPGDLGLVHVTIEVHGGAPISVLEGEAPRPEG